MPESAGSQYNLFHFSSLINDNSSFSSLMFDIVLVCRRPSQLPPMSVQIFIPCLTSPGNLQSAMLLLSRAERRSIITIQCRSVKTTRMARHPAALLLLSLRLLLRLLLSLLMLLSLRLPPRWRQGRSGAGLICVLCTAIKTLQRKKQSELEGERKIQQYGFGSPEQKQCKHRMRCHIRCN
jgi:hypothetical protein